MKFRHTLAIIATTMLWMSNIVVSSSENVEKTMFRQHKNRKVANHLRCTFQKANDLMTWYDHNLEATRMGCNLASIISEEEQEQVRAMYENNIDPSRTRIWIGAMKDPDWKWSDGSPFIYTNWNVNEPSSQAEETRGHLMFPWYPKSKMKWNNRSPADMLSALYKCCD